MQFLNPKRYKKQIKKLYRSAFPAEERAPLFLLFSKTKNKNNSFIAVTDNEEFIGLAYTIKERKIVYVFFLAVEEEKRGKGYGTKILELIKENNPDCTVILMIEDTETKNADNITERINRLKFYKDNGFKQLGIKINEAGVDYELLGTDYTVTKSDFLNIMKKFLGNFLFKLIYRRMKI